MPGPGTLVDALAGSDNATALFCAGGGPRVTRQQLREQIHFVASSLKAAGVKAGDAVSISDTNTIDFVVAFLGVTFARAVAAPLNPNYTADEVKFYVGDAASKLLLVPVRGNAEAEKAAAELGVPVGVVSVSWSDDGLTTRLSAKAGDLRLGGGGGGGPPGDPPHPDDVALFLHTSGTTARPKGVPLTHGNLAASLANIAGTYELQPSDRSLLVMPLFHVHGLMAGMLAPFLAGAAVILPAGGRFSASTFWRDAVEYGATFYTAVPTMHQVLLARADKDYPKAAPPPLRFIRSCSSALAPATLHKLEAAFGVPVLEVAILDAENRPLPSGRIGEVCSRGPNVTKGYLNNPAANKEAFAGGWFHTGDQGFLDEEGYLTLTGRIKELINRGGEKISPIEVDSALLGHPRVAEAVSFAAPDEKYGEVVAAAVVLTQLAGNDTESIVADIRKFAATKLAKFKVPERIFITDKLPKTATGKIQRRHMVGHFMGGGKGGGGGSGSGGVKKNATAAGAPAIRSKL